MKNSRLEVRIPTRVADELRALATRDANGVSATVRRLLTSALAHERDRSDRRPGILKREPR